MAEITLDSLDRPYLRLDVLYDLKSRFAGAVGDSVINESMAHFMVGLIDATAAVVIELQERRKIDQTRGDYDEIDLARQVISLKTALKTHHKAIRDAFDSLIAQGFNESQPALEVLRPLIDQEAQS